MPERQLKAAYRERLRLQELMRGSGAIRGYAPRRETNPIFGMAWKASGLRGKAPPVYSIPQVGSAGFQPYYGPEVFIDPRTAKALRAGPLSKDRAALSVLLHEYAHVRQPAPLKRHLIEAGADLFSLQHSQGVARKLGLDRAPGFLDWDPSRTYPYVGYQNRVTNMVRSPGWRSFVDRGQFGRK